MGAWEVWQGIGLQGRLWDSEGLALTEELAEGLLCLHCNNMFHVLFVM